MARFHRATTLLRGTLGERVARCIQFDKTHLSRTISPTSLIAHGTSQVWVCGSGRKEECPEEAQIELPIISDGDISSLAFGEMTRAN